MADKHTTIRALYKRLLTLYPRAFREQLGESMAQTFNDLYREQQRQPAEGLFPFVCRLFCETAIGIGKEYLLLVREEDPMRRLLTTLRIPAMVGFLLMLPFLLLELIFNPVNEQNAPGLTGLFGLLWLFPLLFVLILRPLIRTLRAGGWRMGSPAPLLLRVAFLVLVAMVWGGILVDQLPCFVGVPNCD
jgi:hypothetical protein